MASSRWQDHGLSISFRACDLRALGRVGEAMRMAAAPGEPAVALRDVAHLDLAENELEDVDGLAAFSSLVSLDIAHNNIASAPPRLASSLLHLNLTYNRLEHVGALSSLTSLVELNLGYNLLTSLVPLERLSGLQVLLVAGNRIQTLDGLAALASLELLDVRHNYIAALEEVRLLALNARLRTLSLGGNPVARNASFRAAVVATLPTLLVLDGQKTPRSSGTRHAAVASAAARPGVATPASGYSAGGAASRTELARSAGMSYGGLRDPAALYARGGAPTTPAPAPVLVSSSGLHATPSRKPSLDSQLRRSSSAAAMTFGRQEHGHLSAAQGHMRPARYGEAATASPEQREAPTQPRGLPGELAQALALAIASKQQLLGQLPGAAAPSVCNGESGAWHAPPETPPIPHRLVYPPAAAPAAPAQEPAEAPARPRVAVAAQQEGRWGAPSNGLGNGLVRSRSFGAYGRGERRDGRRLSGRGGGASAPEQVALGSGVRVPEGVFVPQEAPATLLGSLLKLSKEPLTYRR